MAYSSTSVFIIINNFLGSSTSYDTTSLHEHMGRHREWRKIAKRERRRRIRVEQAKKRESGLEYKDCENWLDNQEALELFEYEQIEQANRVENEKWLRAERIALEQWQRLQDRRATLLQQRKEQEAKLKLEWEMEQEKKKRDIQRLKEIEEEKRQRQEIFMKSLDLFLCGDSVEPPSELLVQRESKSNTEPCPFFSKTACCRFADQCSRNHVYPGISKILLATNFYAQFGLDNAAFNEYDTDVMLEYEESDTYKEFKEFFNDVLPEFEKFGRVVQFKVCNNFEKHLRGNVYVEYAEVRSAVGAYQALHSRWYGGRQLSLQFCHISSWKNAICGLQLRKRCPKGRACNFLHVFRNPNNLFSDYTYHNLDNLRSKQISPRSWRWSKSPESDTPRRKRSRSRERADRRRGDRSRREDPRHCHSERRSRRRRSPNRSSERRKRSRS